MNLFFLFLYVNSYFLLGHRVVTGKYPSITNPSYFLFPVFYILYSANSQIFAILTHPPGFRMYLFADILVSLLVARIAFLSSREISQNLQSLPLLVLSRQLSFWIFTLLLSLIYAISNVHYLFSVPFILLYFQPIKPLRHYVISTTFVIVLYLFSSFIAQTSFGNDSILHGSGNALFWGLLNTARLVPYITAFFCLHYSRFTSFEPKRISPISVSFLFFPFVLFCIFIFSISFINAWKYGLGTYLNSLPTFLYPFILIAFKMVQRSDYILYMHDLMPTYGTIIPDKIAYFVSSIFSPAFSLFDKLGLYDNYSPYDLSLELSQSLRGYGVFNLSIPAFFYFLLENLFQYSLYVLFSLCSLLFTLTSFFSKLLRAVVTIPSGRFLILFFLLTLFSTIYDSRLLEVYVLLFICFVLSMLSLVFRSFRIHSAFH